MLQVLAVVVEVEMEVQVEMAQEMDQAQVVMHSQKCSKLCRMIRLKILNGVYLAFKIKT